MFRVNPKTDLLLVHAQKNIAESPEIGFYFGGRGLLTTCADNAMCFQPYFILTENSLLILWVGPFIRYSTTHRSQGHYVLSGLMSIFVFKALSTVFHSINPPDNSAFSLCSSGLCFCLVGPFNYVPLSESLLHP